MSNHNLKAALQQAGIQPPELAEIVQVDERTVRRWLNGQPPYPRHRGKIARLLDTTEHALWPDLTTAALAATSPPANEVIASHAHGDDPQVPDPEPLIAAATERIELLDASLSPLLDRSGVPELLIERAGHGCQVRLLLSSPGHYLQSVLEKPGIEVRVLDAPEPHTIQRYDNDMLIGLQLAGESDQPPPLLHLRRQAEGGLFDRLTKHYQATWEHDGQPVTTNLELQNYILELSDGSDDSVEDEQPQPQHTPSTPQPEQPPVASGRRWPRRPS